MYFFYEHSEVFEGFELVFVIFYVNNEHIQWFIFALLLLSEVIHIINIPIGIPLLAPSKLLTFLLQFISSKFLYK